MGGARWPAIVVCVLLLVAGVTGGAVAAGTNTNGQGLATLQQSIDADEVRLGIDIREDGSAVWTVEYRVELTTENETAAFESLQSDIAANRSAYVERFATRIEATVVEADNGTDREMTARDFNVTTDVQPLPNPRAPFGVVSYRFEWDGFAAVEDGRLSAGDALGGLFLTERQSLEIGWPSSYSLDRVEPGTATVREQSVVWDGPVSFGDAGPTVVVSPGGPVDPLTAGALAVTVLVLAIIAVWAYRNRSEKTLEVPDDVEPGLYREGGAGSGDEENDEDPPDELLSNEERVLALLEDNGGRVKQQAVVEELGWTAAKTSQVVNGMREEGQLEVFRLGRENVLKLPETDLVDGEDADGE